MGKPTGPTNIQLQSLISDLKHLGSKENVPLWKRLAEELSKSTRKRREVNIGKIDKHIKANEIAVVPGKVLSDGELTKKITIAAFNYSAKAKEKINKAGKAITIRELMKSSPKGKRIRIIG